MTTDELAVAGTVAGVIATVLALIGICLAWLSLHRERKHRQDDAARAVVDWAEDTARLAADIRQAWVKGRSEDETEAQWPTDERRMHRDGPRLLGRLPDKLRTKVEDPAHDLTTALRELLTGNYLRGLGAGEYRGEHPFRDLEGNPTLDSFGPWLNRTTSAISDPLEDFTRPG